MFISIVFCDFVLWNFASKNKRIVQKTTVFIQIKSPERSEFLLNCIEVSKEKRILISLILFRYAKRFIFPLLTRYLSSKQQTSDFSPLSCQKTEKRNNTISQMRLRSVFKMRTSILNTATTEQMGYGIFSFFVYTKSTN